MAGNLTAMIAAAFSGGAAPPVTSDPYYEYTTLLLPGNGTNGAQNNTFLDGSTNNFTITRNGNTTQGTFSPFSQTGWGNYFGSSTSYLKFASDAGFAIGAGNFSIECFVNFTAWSGNQRVCIQGQSGTTNIQIAKDSVSNDLFVDIQGTRVITYAWTPSVGQWYHIALVRSGTGTNQVTLYIDGSSVATGTSSASIAQNQLFIGGIDWASSYNIQGYISNFRYSNVARTITVPTSPYTSDANTLILTCQSNRFVDNSASPKTITVNGTTSVVAFSPFNPSASWSAATYGGSGYFDGSGDYLTADNLNIGNFGTDDFTIECWFYANDLANYRSIAESRTSNGTTTGWALSYDASGTIYFYSNAFIVNSGTGAVILKQWNHVAVTRQSGTNRLFLNGALIQSSATSRNYTDNNFKIATRYDNGGEYFNGYISSFRVVKGTAVYTAAFTPPTAPVTAITNTSLLLNFTNAGIYDATSKNDLETVGNAQISTAISAKWGSGSMYFDGTGDFLSVVSTSLLGYGTGNFTIEFWTYVTSTSNTPYFFDCRTTATANEAVPALYINGGNYEYYVSGAARITVGAVPTNQWVHVALVRNSGTTTLYSNGTSTGTYSDSTSYISCPMVIGQRKDTTSQSLNGYIQDFRVTKGYARYTANFTPPTAAFPTL